jgi:hypothetical protein
MYRKKSKEMKKFDQHRYTDRSEENAIIVSSMRKFNVSRKRFKEVKEKRDVMKNFTLSLRGFKKTDGLFNDFVYALQQKYGHKRFRIFLNYERDSEDMDIWITFFDQEGFDIAMRSFSLPQGPHVRTDVYLVKPDVVVDAFMGKLGMISNLYGKETTSSVIAALTLMNNNN